MDVTPTWYERDLPVLSAIVTFFEERSGEFPQVFDIADATGMDAETVFRSCRALDGEYIDLRMVMAGDDPTPHSIHSVTAEARRAVGQWPSADAWADRIVRGLDDAADKEPDEAKKSKLRAAAEAMGGFGREVLVEVLAGGINKASGLS